MRALIRRSVFGLIALIGVWVGASAGFATTEEVTRVAVHVTEWEFTSVSPGTAPTGTVVFTVFNDGVFPHDFSINGRTTPAIPGGKSTTLTMDFVQPGVYTYVSTVDDVDREMWGGFTVTGAPIATTRATTTDREPTAAGLPLRKVADVALPGTATRFDYQSVDAGRRRLFIAHLGAGSVVAFDIARQRVAGVVGRTPDVRGVLAVPALNRLYAAATGAHALVTFDERNLRRVRSAPAGDFPDGVAYDPRTNEVFVSDVSGEQLTVFRASTGKRIGAVPLGGTPGNVQFDSRTGLIVVAVGSRNELAVVSPRTRKVTRRSRLAGCEDPHGVEVVGSARRAYVACEANATMTPVDLAAMKQRGVFAVGKGPDVLDYDPGLKRLYVASESGTVSAFAVGAAGVRKLGEAVVDAHAHSVAVDPKSHRVYFPLESVDGRPVLRIMRPA